MAKRTTYNVREGTKGFVTTPAKPPTVSTLPEQRNPISETIEDSQANIDDAFSKFRQMVPHVPTVESAANVREWWNSLTERQQELLEKTSREKIANLDGVPYSVRDRLNREQLSEDIERMKHSRDYPEKQAAFIKSVSRALAKPGRERTLIVYEKPRGEGDLENGHAAIGCGDLILAEHVTVLVPGYRGFPARRLDSLVENTDSVLDAADSWSYRQTGRSQSCAGVAWIGYKTPSWRELPTLDAAHKGANSLTSFADGLAEEDHPDITVVGHSYGGVVAALTANRSTHVNRIVLAGAPGAPLVSQHRSASVYVVKARGDHISDLNWFSLTETSAPPLAQMALGGEEGSELNHGHNHYFERNSAVVRQVGAVVTGLARPKVRRFSRSSSKQSSTLSVLSVFRRIATRWEDRSEIFGDLGSKKTTSPKLV